MMGFALPLVLYHHSYQPVQTITHICNECHMQLSAMPPPLMPEVALLAEL